MSRITINERIYYQQEGEQPTSLTVAADFKCDTEDQVFSRTFKVSKDWKKLPEHWLENGVGMIVLHNQEGLAQQQTIPTPEQVALSESKVLEVTFGAQETLLYVSPKDLLRIRPKDVSTLQVRCSVGEIKVLYQAYPK